MRWKAKGILSEEERTWQKKGQGRGEKDLPAGEGLHAAEMEIEG